MQPADIEVPQGEVIELLQQLIRNKCVNDGRPESGDEVRNAVTLTDYLHGSGIDVERFAPTSLPGRASIVARLEGSDPNAPKVCLMGHTDVVPVTAAGWSEDPFGGLLKNGEIWGRGALDMLNLTAAMAVVMRHLAMAAVPPRGDVIFFGVPDEEAAGTWGAQFMVERHWDAIACDYVLTENGGLVSDVGDKQFVTMNVAEKGYAWRKLVVKGTPGHGSMPYGADNALIKAAEIVRRLGAYAPRGEVGELWKRRVATLGLREDLASALIDPGSLDAALATIPSRGAAAHFHACTHTTFSPNVVHGGVKANVIPDRVEIDLDIRTLPGESVESVQAHLREALQELADDVEITAIGDADASFSPVETPMWAAMTAATRARYPRAELVPAMIVGLTDARFFRHRGVTAYGAGLMSRELSAADFSSRFHGHNERVDADSVNLTTSFFAAVLDHLWS